MDKFIKENPIPGSESLVCEREGLESIHAHQSKHGILTPRILEFSREQMTFEKIDVRAPSAVHFASFGSKLAKLHQVTGKKFGWSRDNFIGLNPQANAWHSDWGKFFLEQRLRRQIEMIRDQRLQSELRIALEKSKEALMHFLNAHAPAPSLLHGDLWSGNFLCSEDDVYLIDPAVYFGDRECDIAMTNMFGGFGSVFYRAYEDTWSLPEGFEERAVIYNLYHYLNHFNLFGESYLRGVQEGIRALLVLP